jgi:hypothetical protein
MSNLPPPETGSVSSTGEGKDRKATNDSVWQRALSGNSVPANNSSTIA